VTAIPSWVGIASPHAMITKDEVLEWIRITGSELRAMVLGNDFPKPRFGTSSNGHFTNRTRWRVGDVRAWAAGAEKRLEVELAKPIGESQTSKGAVARKEGRGPMARTSNDRR
jgi:hypothetical protein